MTLLLQWLCDAWVSSILRALTVGGFAIVLFWLLDRCCRSLRAMHRSWLWRLLYVKLAALLVCSTTFLSLPIAQTLDVLPSLAMTNPISDLGNGSPIGETIETHGDATVATTVSARTRDADGMGNFGIKSGLALRFSLMIAWITVVLFLIGTAISRYRSTIHCIRSATVPTDAATQSLYLSLVMELGIAKQPELRLVSLDMSPCLVWEGHSCVVLPYDFFQLHGMEACRMAMAHELGHFVRRDLLWNGLVTLVSTWLFFFPLVWLMNKRYRLALEMACDAYTIDRAHIDRHNYASLLVGLLDSRSRWAASTTFVAMAGSGSFRSLSTRLNAMKFQRQDHIWLQRLSLGAVACVVSVSLLPWGFADDDGKKQKRKNKSNAEKPQVETSNVELTTVESASASGVTNSSKNTDSSSTTTLNGRTINGTSGGGSGVLHFSMGLNRGEMSGSAKGAGSSAGGGSARSGHTNGHQSSGESISKTTNVVDGKRTMSVDVSTKNETIRIREDSKGAFEVNIDDRTNNNAAQKVYTADNRKEFSKTYPDVFAKIQTYLQDQGPLSALAPLPSVAPLSPLAPVAPLKPMNATLVPGSPLAVVEGVPLAPLFEGRALPQVVVGLPILPAIPAAPAPPAPPALKGVIEALDKIRAESAGNAEIERLIESIKAKIDDKN